MDAAKNVYLVDGGHHRLQKFRYVPDAVEVSVLLEGMPWPGPIGYTVPGPQTLAGTAAPQTLTGAAGAYTPAYVSGGPPGASFTGVAPSPTQSVAGGGTAAFTLSFATKKAETGIVVVEATLAGAGGAAPWTGQLNFTLTGPQTLLGSSVGQSFANAPAGTYTLTYVSGGPPGMALASITPSPAQTLAPGGVVTFRMNFR